MAQPSLWASGPSRRNETSAILEWVFLRSFESPWNFPLLTQVVSSILRFSNGLLQGISALKKWYFLSWMHIYPLVICYTATQNGHGICVSFPIQHGGSLTIVMLSKEVWKLNFRQYGQMQKHSQDKNLDVERVRREKLRDGEVRREKMQVREKVGKLQTLCFSNALWLRRVEK